MKKVYIILGSVCAALAILCVVLFLPKKSKVKSPVFSEISTAVEKYDAEEQKNEGYVSPIDFASLQEINPDIYAWIYVPEAGINHPILQSVSGDDNYYLTHNVELQEDDAGCLFTQRKYSDKEFDIRVTVIYGHRRRSGEMFGNLEKQLSSENGIYKYNKIIIYTPEKELHYQVFGESQYSDDHIVFENNLFRTYDDLTSFLNDVRQYHTFTHQFDDSVTLSENDRVLVLSTCLERDENQRFLVLAKLVDEIN